MDYYWVGLTDEGIAGKFGLTVANVMRIRQRALNKLRTFLQAPGSSSAKQGARRQ
jgi:DNA-directed RNA polymerase specialized sigma24 family protein